MGTLTFKSDIVPGSTSQAYALGSPTQLWKIYGLLTGTANNAVLAGTADYAISSGCAIYSISAGYALTSGCANYAALSGTATYAQGAGYTHGTLTIVNTVFNGSEDVTVNIKDLGLTQTMSFLGVTDTTAVYNESTTDTIHLIGGTATTVENGNVVLSKWTGLEYLWSDGMWQELGLATSYALASHIHGNIESNGTVSSTATIVNGTGLAIIEPSGALNKAAHIIFDGETENLVLAKSGTWVPSSDYQLPAASSTTLGGIIVGTGLTIDEGILSVQLSSTTNNSSTSIAATPFAVKMAYDLAASKTDNLGTVVEVTAGTGLSTTAGSVFEGGTITTNGALHLTLTGATAGSYGLSEATVGIHDTAILIPHFTIDDYGRVTEIEDVVYTAQNDDTLNTTGSTNSTTAMYLVGAYSQSASNITYSHSAVYAEAGTLYATTFVGALEGTASNALLAHTANFAITAGYATTAEYCANAGTDTIYNTTATTSWVGTGTGPFTQTLVVPGMTDETVPIMSINLSSIAYASIGVYLQEYSYIYRCVTGTNQVTLYACAIPQLTLPIQLKF